ncbi:hypothetical protein RFI_21929 [Reticulomyxa filosa]|uniref:Uncharacterized protein n=1 Tax=Reticulomyxa filosa TaxID=46433 RepID=X6MNM7_RETFI|nr:hypothetical protein RFI_21929 [Reticulomyxa filosa]|eukprot:ETO15434.1 hypothetical protein RFI_21929 [Reticulomyxa filosa]
MNRLQSYIILNDDIKNNLIGMNQNNTSMIHLWPFTKQQIQSTNKKKIDNNYWTLNKFTKNCGRTIPCSIFKAPQKLEEYSDAITSIQFSSNGFKMVSSSNNKTIRLWKLHSQYHKINFSGSEDNNLCLWKCVWQGGIPFILLFFFFLNSCFTIRIFITVCFSGISEIFMTKELAHLPNFQSPILLLFFVLIASLDSDFFF